MGAELMISDRASEAEMEVVMDSYMAIYILGKNHSLMTPAEIEFTRQNVHKAYPTWPETQKFVRGVRRDVLGQAEGSTSFSFDETVRVLEEVGDRYGRWQDSE